MFMEKSLDTFCVAPFLEGCGTGAGLIIAIGAQNAFVGDCPFFNSVGSKLRLYLKPLL